MCKFNLIILLLLVSCGTSWATPPTRAYNYVPNAVIDPTQNNANENALYSYVQTGVDTYAPGSISASDINANAAIGYSQLSLMGSIQKSDFASSVQFVLPTGAVFFMASGSCPTGTTDISATYSNKFVKINSTQLTSSGTVLTATTDAHVLTQAELPTANGTFTRYDGNGSALTGVQGTTNGQNAVTQNVALGGSNTGHTHTISSATTLEPSSITMKACLVN